MQKSFRVVIIVFVIGLFKVVPTRVLCSCTNCLLLHHFQIRSGIIFQYDFRHKSCRCFGCPGTVEVEVTITGKSHFFIGVVYDRTIDCSAGVTEELDSIAGYRPAECTEAAAERYMETRSHNEGAGLVIKPVELGFFGKLCDRMAFDVAAEDDLIYT